MPKLKMNKCEGVVTIPASKSISHRALICACLADGSSEIKNVTFSKDILATIDCLRNLGQEIIINDDSIVVIPHKILKKGNLNANESGSTLRFMIPLLLMQDEQITITGENHLKKRPISDYFPIFEQNDVEYSYNGELPLKLKGKLKPGKYVMNGNVSSQFISGMLFALPLLDGDSTIILKNELESVSYVDMTIEVCKFFGVTIEKIKEGYFIRGKQKYLARNYTIEGDFSQSAFFLVMNALGAKLELKGLVESHLQGDERILDILRGFGVSFDSRYMVEKIDLKPQVVSLKNEPDLAPVLALFATSIPGKTIFKDLARLKYKECDRLLATKALLEALGANVVAGEDYLEIEGGNKLHEGFINTYNDHRILMTAAVSTLIVKKVEVDSLEPVKKSFPNFFEIYKQIGGEVDE